MNANPYRPIDISVEDVALLEYVDAAPLQWQVDWSKDGVRKLKARWWGPVLQASFGILIIGIWLVIVPMVWAQNSLKGGELFVFLAVSLALGWCWWLLFHMQSGQQFVNVFPCLAGDAEVTMDRGLVTIAGHEIAIAVRKRVYGTINPYRRFNEITLPRYDTKLPLDGLDSRPIEPIDRPIIAAKSSPAEMLSYLPVPIQHESSIEVEGMLTGRHFGTLNCRQHWLVIAIACGAVGFVLMTVAVFELVVVSRREYWVNREDDIVALSMFGIVFGIVFGLVSFNYIFKRFRKTEEFSALITPDCVAIANNRIAYAYFGEALKQFAWTDHGLIAVNKRGTVKFLLPIAWFTPDQRTQVASWHPPGDHFAKSQTFVGPYI